METLEGFGNIEDDGFSSKATTMEGFWRDFHAYSLSALRNSGQLNSNEGRSDPDALKGITSYEKHLTALEGAMARRTLKHGPGGLDARSEHPMNTYGQRRYNFLLESEGLRNRAYDDKTGRPIVAGTPKKGLATIGVGFNMDRPGALSIFINATGLGKKEFEETKSGARKLPNDQIRKIFDLNVRDAERIVSARFRGVNISEHQRLALVSLAFNGPGLFGPNLVRLVKSGDFKAVAKHITTALNKSGIRGVEDRRFREAQMFLGPTHPRQEGYNSYRRRLDAKK